MPTPRDYSHLKYKPDSSL
jgi:hypothetical protein